MSESWFQCKYIYIDFLIYSLKVFLIKHHSNKHMITLLIWLLSFHPQVSFADFGWDQYIIIPSSYNARFCGGRCNWPLQETHNTTRHSYIQAVVNFGNPKEVPPPCCAPKPDTLGKLNVVIKDSNGTFVTRWWDDMIATDCACLWNNKLL